MERTRPLTTSNEELRREIADRQPVEEAPQESQAGLAHATRVRSMGELVISIAAESTTADRRGDSRQFALRQLDTQAPNLRKVREASAEIGRELGPALSSTAFARC